MSLSKYLEQVKNDSDNLDFSDLMSVIDENYDFTPTQFTNGGTVNEAGQNDGSCKLFSFAKLHQLTEQQTLACFGTYYRIDVLQHPENDDHQNIRNFIISGWSGIQFESSALSEK